MPKEHNSTAAPIQNNGAQPPSGASEVWELFQKLNPSKQAKILQLMIDHLMSNGVPHHG
jgi:hypothetical protein